MPDAQRLALPLSIVLGCSIIGAGLYFGLRATQPTTPAASPPTTAPPVVPPTANPTTPATPSTPTEPPPTTTPEARAQQQAQAALDSLQPQLSRACWTPPEPGEPTTIVLEYDVTFSPDGSVVMLGIGEQRKAFRSGVAECVRQQGRPALPIDPPGTPARAMLELRLP